MGANALAESLGISRQEAKEFIDHYFETHPGVAKYMEETVERAKVNGYVKTLTGRRRNLPDILSSNRGVAEFAKRTAINTPIQGSAADLIKIAMVHIYNDIKKRNMSSRMILQVHDELVFDVPVKEREELSFFVRDRMEHALELSVPLKIDEGWGKNWREAH